MLPYLAIKSRKFTSRIFPGLAKLCDGSSYFWRPRKTKNPYRTK